jgi:hypothetical protein
MLKTPFTAVLSGPSGSGKTQLLTNILLHQPPVFDYSKIVFFYKHWQPLYDVLLLSSNIKFYQFWIQRQDDADDLEALFKAETRNSKTCFVFDDGLEACKSLTDVFTQLSHHYNCNVFLLVQSLFDPALRVITRNVNYLFLFRSIRDAAQIRHIAYQIFPERNKAKSMICAFKDATREPYNYLLLDFKPETPDYLRLKSSILADEPIVYCLESPPPETI